jgi:hypothetical protein
VEGGRAAFVRIEFGCVRPKIDGERIRILRIAPAPEPMAPANADGAITGAGEPTLVTGNVDTAQRSVEMDRAACCLGPCQARGDDHQRLRKQADEPIRVTQHTLSFGSSYS